MQNKNTTDKILIVDFGSQVTQLIARRIRDSGVYCEIVPYFKITTSFLNKYLPKGIILSGGPASVIEYGSPTIDQTLFAFGSPILGICYGQQIMVNQLGGSVEVGSIHEYGKADLTVTAMCSLFEGIWSVGAQYPVWMSHGDQVTELPPGFRTSATSKGAPYAVMVDESRKFYGVQFHPEVIHTPQGADLLKNFSHKISGCASTWSMTSFRNNSVDKIREKVGTDNVVCGLSGGVDSSVTAVLLHEAIGDQLHCIFVDTGLLRLNEAKEVIDLFRNSYDIKLSYVDASDLFLFRLLNVTDPEAKRKIIGNTFIDVFEAEAREIKDAKFLAQGTLYPDVIESVSVYGGPSTKIKSHHNVGGLPDRMNLQLVEPLRELFKDEVRMLGRELGLPEQLINRHPFPGPGLTVRIPGAVTKEKADILREVDFIFIDEIRNFGLYLDIWQAFAVPLPVRSVGVMGDARSYDYVVALRAVTSVDGMTADSYPFAHSFLSKVTSRIVNEVRGVSRVVYDITSKPPGTIEWE